MARVLLAADAEPVSNRVVARLALEAAGHDVYEAYDGYDVLTLIDSTRPDLVVLDTALVGLDGIQVLDRLRRHPTQRHLPVVVISGIARDVVGELTYSLGATRFLERPFTNAALAEAVDTALASQPAVAGRDTPAAAAPGWRRHTAGAARGRHAADGAGVVDLPLPAPRRARASRRRPRGA